MGTGVSGQSANRDAGGVRTICLGGLLPQAVKDSRRNRLISPRWTGCKSSFGDFTAYAFGSLNDLLSHSVLRYGFAIGDPGCTEESHFALRGQ